MRESRWLRTSPVFARQETHRLPPSCLVVAELPLGAIRAVERELRGLIVGEVRLPAVLVRRQPDRATLGALRDCRDAFGTHTATES
jgi:hypothetical protein